MYRGTIGESAVECDVGGLPGDDSQVALAIGDGTRPGSVILYADLRHPSAVPPDLLFHLSEVLISTGVLSASGGTETELACAPARSPLPSSDCQAAKASSR